MWRGLALALILLPAHNAFLVPSTSHGRRGAGLIVVRNAGTPLPSKEPGVEVSQLEVVDVGENVNKYSVSSSVSPELYKKLFKQILAEQKNNARYRGFRAGTVPPVMRDAAKEFAVFASIEERTLDNIELYGLTATVPFEGARPNIKIVEPEDIPKFAKTYKDTDSFPFKTEVEAKGSPTVGGGGDEEVVDVEAKAVEEAA